VAAFVSRMAKTGLKGAIIPDLPPEEGQEYLKAMADHELSPVLIFSPTTPLERMQYLSEFAQGFAYCVDRKGVTGAKTDFALELDTYRLNAAMPLPSPWPWVSGSKKNRTWTISQERRISPSSAPRPSESWKRTGLKRWEISLRDCGKGSREKVR